MPQPTAHRYLNLLETSYLLVRLPAYSVKGTKRLIKSPKLSWGDTGVALYLADGVEPTGNHLENIVRHDLLAWCDASAPTAGIFYWRTTTGEEDDFVIEAQRRLLPIEIKVTTRRRHGDTVHLRTFHAVYPDAACPGLLHHTGTTTEWLTSNVLAVPWWKIV